MFFFNTLQVHDSVVRDLKSKAGDLQSLNNDAKELFGNYLCERLPSSNLTNECINYRDLPNSTDYFEALYQILHIRYKYRSDSLVKFFNDYNWRIRHYLRSFISVAKLVDELVVDRNKKNAYMRLLQSRSSNDELRLMFYYIISSGDKEIAILFDSYRFFDTHIEPLIKEGDRELFRILLHS